MVEAACSCLGGVISRTGAPVCGGTWSFRRSRSRLDAGTGAVACDAVSATSTDGVGGCIEVGGCDMVGLAGNVEKGPSVTDRCAGGRPRILPPAVLLFVHAEDTAGPCFLRFDEAVTADRGDPNTLPAFSTAENG